MSGAPDDRTFHRVFPSILGVYQPLIDEIVSELSDRGWSKVELFGVHMALEESISNAIRHGNKEDVAKEVTVACRIQGKTFWAQISDQGTGFCRATVPDCCREDRLEATGGRGLALIEAYMDLVEYNDCGNTLTLEKTSTATQAPPRPQ